MTWKTLLANIWVETNIIQILFFDRSQRALITFKAISKPKFGSGNVMAGIWRFFLWPLIELFRVCPWNGFGFFLPGLTSHIVLKAQTNQLLPPVEVCHPFKAVKRQLVSVLLEV